MNPYSVIVLALISLVLFLITSYFLDKVYDKNGKQIRLQLKLLRETRDYYLKHNRSVNEVGDCVYNGPNGEKCAFSRICIDPSLLPEETDIHEILGDFGKEILLPKWRSLDKWFLIEIQKFHDNAALWEGQKLTKIGEEYYNTLIKTVKAGRFITPQNSPIPG